MKTRRAPLQSGKQEEDYINEAMAAYEEHYKIPFKFRDCLEHLWIMPKFDPMDLTVSNKSVLSFNLSFFADETEVLSKFFAQICTWIEEGKLRPPRVVDMLMTQVVEGHELIQSGKSIGKIVLTTAS